MYIKDHIHHLLIIDFQFLYFDEFRLLYFLILSFISKIVLVVIRASVVTPTVSKLHTTV